MNSMQEFLAQYDKLLPVGTSISYTEAERRAGEFLVGLATIAAWRHGFADEKIKLLSVQTAVYAQEMNKGTAPTVTVNKMNAEASPEYTKAREELERIENDLAYLKAYQEILLNGHLFYRNMAKGDNA